MLSNKIPYNFDRIENATTRNPQASLTLVPGTRKGISKEVTPLQVCKMKDPVTNIGLSLELLEATLTEPGQKIYIDIIRRNNLRINNFITLLLASQQELIQKEHSIPLF